MTKVMDNVLRIGTKVRHTRKVRGLRLRELADRVGCSESLLSKIENDKARPSLEMLHRIVSELGISISTLFMEKERTSGVVMRAGGRPVIGVHTLTRGEGLKLESLIPESGTQLLNGSIHIVMPGGGSEGDITHEGEELGYILVGELDLTVDGQTYRLKPGDSFFFRSDLAHGYRNPGDVETRVLWVNTPPTF